MLGVSACAQQGKDSSFARLIVKDSIAFFPMHILPPDYYSSHTGFFCKKELQIQKAIKLPISFRLGSLDYCDRMEGKHN
jgi:hypothetical protein